MDVTNTLGRENLVVPSYCLITLQPDLVSDVVLAAHKTYEGQNEPFFTSLSKTIASE